jgi:hypothetical protein
MDHQTNIKEIAHILSEIDDIALIEDFLKNILTETDY